MVAAPHAAAECAWVLRNEVTGSAGSEWILVQRVPTAQQWDSYLRAKVKNTVKNAKAVVGNIVTLKVGDKVLVFRLTWIPDTFDAREPRRGGR